MKLYGYWRSGTSYRVRIALALKGAEAEAEAVNLLASAHREPSFLKLNPQGLVPALELGDGRILAQSPAIIEYLDEVLPGPKLLPEEPFARAKARQLAALIGCDVHPLQNLRVLRYLQDVLGHSRDEAFAFAAHWIDAGLAALEQELAALGGDGPYLMGSRPTVPDCYLLPQLYAGRRFGADIDRFTRLLKIEEALLALPAVAAAQPDRQPDAMPG